MSIITGLEVQKKNETRANLYLDDEFYAGVSNEFLDTPFLLKVSLYLFARYLRCRGTLLSLEWQRPRGRILRIERS